MPPSPDGYRIMREIHRGGQGVVYLAEQESTCRTVALKVMREGPLASDAERVRFKQEVHVLAALRHPNIVTIHDSGESGGRFYYIMDYIEGLPLDAYVRVNRPAVNDTLRLFVKIADAVNAAHLRGVIHRDLKPPNVLVDRQGRPHVLDFGLAKVLSGDDDSAEGAALTRTGEFVGSLPWASPEQAEGRHDDVDLRTDVYALGVLLYQALTGRFPYPVAGAVRAVLDNIVNAAPQRPRTIRSQIGDEVETIVLKCLAKDRARRYQSAGEVARDLEHYLNGEPIEAKRDSFGYLLRKQLRKHRLLTGFAGALVLFSGSLASSSFFAWTSYLRAERLAAAESAARDQAQRDRKRAETINEFVTNALVSADPNRGGAQGFLVTDAMQRAIALLDGGALHDQPETEAALRLTIAIILDGNARSEQALRLAQRALEIEQVLHSGDHADLAANLNNVGLCLDSLGRSTEALPKFEAALQMKQRLFQGDHPTLAADLNNMASCLNSLGRSAEALPRYEAALEIFRRVLPPGDPRTLFPQIGLARTLVSLGRYAEAEPLLRDAAEQCERSESIRRRRGQSVLEAMVNLYDAWGKPELADPYRQELRATTSAPADDR